jgi:hypothetical protein
MRSTRATSAEGVLETADPVLLQDILLCGDVLAIAPLCRMRSQVPANERTLDTVKNRKSLRVHLRRVFGDELAMPGLARR